MKSYIITLLLLCFSLGAWAEGTTKSITITFSEGTTPKSQRKAGTGTAPTEAVLFESFYTSVNLTVSGCVIVPGERTYNDTRLVDFYGAVGSELKSEMKGTANQLDCETFYFYKDYTQSGNDLSTDVKGGSLYAYTFTGWHIKNGNGKNSSAQYSDYIKNGYYAPAQTVFQPGDVITPEVLKDFGLMDADGNVTGTLELEALWGKCYFAKDGGSGSAYYNVNTPTTFVTAFNAVDCTTSEYAYGAVIMLTGYTSYTMFKRDNNFTVKSLQAVGDGNKYEFHQTDGGTTNSDKPGYRFRIDNVISSNVLKTSYYWFNKTVGNMPMYVELTARLEGYFSTFASTVKTLFVFNGGRCKNAEWLGYGPSPNYNLDIFMGRNLYFSSDFLPGCNGGSDTGEKMSGYITVTITGGTYKDVVSLQNSVGTYTKDAKLYVYGNQGTSTEYNPQIPEINASPIQPLGGNVYMRVNGCTGITNLYCGGSAYTATSKNSTFLYLYNSTIKGSVNVGGKYGSVDGTATLDMKNSTVKGNIYGSGMGSTSIANSTFSFISNQPKSTSPHTNVASPPTGFPTYDTSNQSVLMYKRAFVSWWSYEGSGTYNISVRNYTAQLSSAYANATKLNIENSTVGDPDVAGSGNVYGGGADATVKTNTEVTLKNSTVYGSVYGGGDGVTKPSKVKLCQPLSASEYTAPTTQAYYDAYMADKTLLQYAQKPDPLYDDSYGEYYSWSNDAAVLEAGGIDKTNKLIYSENMVGWGEVQGSTNVSITGGTVYGNVFGGGNSGKVGYNSVKNTNTGGGTTLLIDGTDVRGSVFGGGNAALIGGNTSVKIIGPAKVAGNVYGGGNAGEVAGTTKVQIGEPDDAE